METKNISDSEKLTRYISSLPHGTRFRFTVKIAEGCEVTIPTIDRWRTSGTSIKVAYKEKIEQIAGEKIFSVEKEDLKKYDTKKI
ncbi:MAG: hypothetical protein LBL13_04675 [Bacteroidales bacterium]|jgi:hypothetical protein|nr:hypothetical protein [Bacteroidales bacterium]